MKHTIALTENGRVYAWGENFKRALLGNPNVESQLLPKPIEASRDVRVGSIAVADLRSCAVAETGQLWAWGLGGRCYTPLGHGEQTLRYVTPPKLVEALQGIKVDAVVASYNHMLALADDGRVYAWGSHDAARAGALGLSLVATLAVRTPEHIPALLVAFGP
jgi:alpha-tubulin suppressor-like RCC1 family protein